jgi:hypothetical protein
MSININPAIKTRWIKALRSGDYRQNIGELKRNCYFCAVGVLCDLAVQDGVAKWGDPGHGTVECILDLDNSVPETFAEFDVASIYPCPSIYTWLDSSLEEANLGIIMGMNDGGGDLPTFVKDSNVKSFTEIADFLEKDS